MKETCEKSTPAISLKVALKSLGRNNTKLAGVEERLRRLKEAKRRLISRRRILLFQIHILENYTPPSVPDKWDDWRCMPITTLGIHKITGIGESRREALVKAFPTIGELEHYRVTVGISNLPGWNSGLRKRLEGKLIEWLRRYAQCYVIPRSADHAPTRPIKQLAEELRRL